MTTSHFARYAHALQLAELRTFFCLVVFVTFVSGGCSPFPVYSPSGDGPFPAVIILHAGTGLLPDHLNYAADLRSQGYVTIVPQYCSNYRDCDHVPNHSEHLRIIAKAYDRLKSLPSVDPNRIGIVGFSRGGAKALSFPERYPQRRLRGIVAYYPGPIRYFSFGRTENPPILILQGDLDEEAGSGWIKGYCSAQREVGRLCEFKIYPGVYHGFVGHYRRYGGHDPSAAADAFERTVNFLNKHVKGR